LSTPRALRCAAAVLAHWSDRSKRCGAGVSAVRRRSRGSLRHSARLGPALAHEAAPRALRCPVAAQFPAESLLHWLTHSCHIAMV